MHSYVLTALHVQFPVSLTVGIPTMQKERKSSQAIHSMDRGQYCTSLSCVSYHLHGLFCPFVLCMLLARYCLMYSLQDTVLPVGLIAPRATWDIALHTPYFSPISASISRASYDSCDAAICL